MHINGKTCIVAVLGHPALHTASPAMHNAAFDALGLNWCYVAFDVEPANFRTALHGLAMLGVVGVNLTLPHKIVAMRFVNRFEESARQLGAVNTLRFSIVHRRPCFHGFNTDGYGLLKALQKEFSFQPCGKTIAILGCGGAGQGAAIQLALAKAKKLILLNRTRSKAFAIARQIRALKLSTMCVFESEPCDLVVQATSLGLQPSDPLPISRDKLHRFAPTLFFDMIYRPAETPAMGLAREHGCRTANGLSMLLHQGAKAFEIWTKRKAPLEVMRRALKKEVYGR